jgi:hypothetical protein
MYLEVMPMVHTTEEGALIELGKLCFCTRSSKSNTGYIIESLWLTSAILLSAFPTGGDT